MMLSEICSAHIPSSILHTGIFLLAVVATVASTSSYTQSLLNKLLSLKKSSQNLQRPKNSQKPTSNNKKDVQIDAEASSDYYQQNTYEKVRINPKQEQPSKETTVKSHSRNSKKSSSISRSKNNAPTSSSSLSKTTKGASSAPLFPSIKKSFHSQNLKPHSDTVTACSTEDSFGLCQIQNQDNQIIGWDIDYSSFQKPLPLANNIINNNNTSVPTLNEKDSLLDNSFISDSSPFPQNTTFDWSVVQPLNNSISEPNNPILSKGENYISTSKPINSTMDRLHHNNQPYFQKQMSQHQNNNTDMPLNLANNNGPRSRSNNKQNDSYNSFNNNNNSSFLYSNSSHSSINSTPSPHSHLMNQTSFSSANPPIDVSNQNSPFQINMMDQASINPPSQSTRLNQQNLDDTANVSMAFGTPPEIDVQTIYSSPDDISGALGNSFSENSGILTMFDSMTNSSTATNLSESSSTFAQQEGLLPNEVYTVLEARNNDSQPVGLTTDAFESAWSEEMMLNIPTSQMNLSEDSNQAIALPTSNMKSNVKQVNSGTCLSDGFFVTLPSPPNDRPLSVYNDDKTGSGSRSYEDLVNNIKNESSSLASDSYASTSSNNNTIPSPVLPSQDCQGTDVPFVMPPPPPGALLQAQHNTTTAMNSSSMIMAPAPPMVAYNHNMMDPNMSLGNSQGMVTYPMGQQVLPSMSENSSDMGQNGAPGNLSYIRDRGYPFVCPHCKATFRIRGYLTRHIKKHAVHKAYVCPFFNPADKTPCHPTGGFSRRDTYKTHLKARHFIYPPGTRMEHRSKVSGACRGCGISFQSNEEWVEDHIHAKNCPGLVNSTSDKETSPLN